MQNNVLILDFGSPYTQLIARKVRALHIYCEIHPYHSIPKNLNPFKAVILSDSPVSVFSEEGPQIDFSQLGEKPVLAIGYSAALLALSHNGKAESSGLQEPVDAGLKITEPDLDFFKDIPENSTVRINPAHRISSLPENGISLASAGDFPHAVFKIKNRDFYGIQFHPELYQTEYGTDILRNFLLGISGLEASWTPAGFVQNTVQRLQEQLKNERVVLGLSGGVDSTVAAMLLHRAVGKNLYCIFVNHGLLRKNEFEEVLDQYQTMGLNVKGVDASAQFLRALQGKSDPEEKRKAIGATFIEVFDQEAHQIQDVTWLAQGTIYPDVIESVSVTGNEVSVKSHHNVGGLPDFMKLQIVEPLRMLFKDEVREVGREMGIASDLLGRHPFPGPGLAIRILGEITADKISVLQEVDFIFISKLKEWDLYDSVWQAGSVLLPVNSVGVTDGERTYEQAVALRAVNSVDGMTAEWVHLPYDFLQEVSNSIINKVRGVNRVVYDISSKPPATIEWE